MTASTDGKKRRRLKRAALIVVLLLVALSVYPAFVLGYTWAHVANADFEGGRNGPLDAYRHTLASAIVSYTLDDTIVSAISFLMESGGLDSNAMDIHNNAIGARIGTTATSFSEIEPAVHQSIVNGKEGASEEDQITWLPKERWSDSVLW